MNKCFNAELRRYFKQVQQANVIGFIYQFYIGLFTVSAIGCKVKNGFKAVFFKDIFNLCFFDNVAMKNIGRITSG